MMTLEDAERRFEPVHKFAEDAFLRPIAMLCLVQRPLLGLGLWLVLFLQPQLALAAAAALLLIGIGAKALRRGPAGEGVDVIHRANGLLSALVGAWLFLPGDQALLLKGLLIAGTVLGGLFLSFFAKDLLARSGLPVLVWPYCLVALVLFTLFPAAPARSLAYFGWPTFDPTGIAGLADTFLRSLGTFLFSPWPLSGALIGAVVLAWSPAMLLAGVTGWLMGAAVSALLVAAGATFYWASASYNFFLTGMALGAVFFLPGLRGLVYAAIGGAVTAVLAAFLQLLFQYSAASFLPIPFALTLYMGLVLLAAPPFGAASDRTETWNRKPEHNRIARDWFRARWGREGTPLVGIPLSGVLEITQGFGGSTSHQGKWRYALDFQRPLAGARGKATRPSVWGETIFSPVSGEVIDFRQSVPDNPLGSVNYADNWGNYIVLKTTHGSHVLLGHLMQNSVTVLARQSVDNSTQLGLVGNSGRSPVPHLHVQAQTGPYPGAPTQTFRLANYLVCDPDTMSPVEWRASGKGACGDLVMAATPNLLVRNILSGMLPGRGMWVVTPGTGAQPSEQTPGPIQINTMLQDDGTYSISSGENERMTVALEFDGLRLETLHASSGSLIQRLAMCLATIPYAAAPGLSWTDWLPRTYGSLAERCLGEFAGLAETSLEEVTFRYENVESRWETEFAVIATLRDRAGRPGLNCKVRIAQLRGPVEIIVNHGKEQTVYRQISFEPHER